MAEDLLTLTYAKLRNVLKGNARRILGDDAEADDVLQDAFVRLWTKQYAVTREREAESLIARAVRNESIDRVRRRKAKPYRDELSDDIACEERDPKAISSALLEVESIIDSQLSPLQKKIIRLHEYRGLSIEMVAAKLEMNPPAVRMQLSRARKVIRNSFNNE